MNELRRNERENEEVMMEVRETRTGKRNKVKGRSTRKEEGSTKKTEKGAIGNKKTGQKTREGPGDKSN